MDSYYIAPKRRLLFEKYSVISSAENYFTGKTEDCIVTKYKDANYIESVTCYFNNGKLIFRIHRRNLLIRNDMMAEVKSILGVQHNFKREYIKELSIKIFNRVVDHLVQSSEINEKIVEREFKHLKV